MERCFREAQPLSEEFPAIAVIRFVVSLTLKVLFVTARLRTSMAEQLARDRIFIERIVYFTMKRISILLILTVLLPGMLVADPGIPMPAGVIPRREAMYHGLTELERFDEFMRGSCLPKGTYWQTQGVWPGLRKNTVIFEVQTANVPNSLGGVPTKPCILQSVDDLPLNATQAYLRTPCGDMVPLGTGNKVAEAVKVVRTVEEGYAVYSAELKSVKLLPRGGELLRIPCTGARISYPLSSRLVAFGDWLDNPLVQLAAVVAWETAGGWVVKRNFHVQPNNELRTLRGLPGVSGPCPTTEGTSDEDEGIAPVPAVGPPFSPWYLNQAVGYAQRGVF